VTERFWGIGLAAAAAMAATGTAHAQRLVDVQVQVHVDVARIREVQRDIVRVARDLATSDIGRQVSEAISRAFADVGRLGGLDASLWQDRDRQFPAEETRREKRTIALGPTGTLDLRNISGDITVTAGSGDVAIEIVRRARGRTDADVRRGLDEVTTDIDHRGDRATVSTRHLRTDRLPYRVAVDYIVTAPAGTTLTVNTTAGDVSVTGIAGPLVVETVAGDIRIAQARRLAKARAMAGDITLTDVDADAGLDAGTFSGDVRLERVKARRLAVDGTSGDIVAIDVAADDAMLKTISGDVEFSGPLAANGRYELRAHSGDVRMTIAGSTGFTLEATTFSGSVRPDAALGLTTTATTRRSTRGTVGNGSARVVASTFSGEIVITKR
jgi:DUF4097 and DUF4098 domain-containing protein YvlB